MSNTGKFFVLEGLNGCGKTTVMKRLREDFPEALFTREPGGSPFGEKIREILLSDVAKDESSLTHLLGFWASRSSHFDKVIVPALRQNQTVFSDRFDASSYAFQVVASRNYCLESLFFQMRDMVFSGIVLPRYIYLETHIQTAMARANQKSKDHFDSRNPNYQTAVARGYERFFHDKRIFSPVSFVDAEQDRDAVYEDVLSIIRE